MQNIDINKLKEIKEELELLDRDDVLFVDDEDETKFAILPIEKYDEFEELVNLLSDAEKERSDWKNKLDKERANNNNKKKEKL